MLETRFDYENYAFAMRDTELIRAKGSAPAVVAKQNLAGALVFALNNVLVDDSTSPIPVAPWPVLAWLASVLGWLGYRRTRAKRA